MIRRFLSGQVIKRDLCLNVKLEKNVFQFGEMGNMVRSGVFVLAVFLMCFSLSDASLCKPLSTFMVDCNSCTCSENGMAYSCSEYYCPPQYNEKYDVKETEEGYKLYVPKSNNDQYVFDDDNNFVVSTKRRVPRIPEGYPYINDEIPSSKEVSDGERNSDKVEPKSGLEDDGLVFEEADANVDAVPISEEEEDEEDENASNEEDDNVEYWNKIMPRARDSVHIE